MPAIHQFVAGFSNADAISNEACVLRRVFRDWGYESSIFSEQSRILPERRREALDVGDCGPADDDIVLLHLSIGSPVNEAFEALRCRKAILYHNITPPHFYDLVNKQTAVNLARGREQVRALAGSATVTMADSRFNADELEAAGHRNVEVLPLVLDLDSLRGAADTRVRRRFDDGKTTVLFVGRCVPNKKIEDALKAFAFYHHYVNRESRFIHVGSAAGAERYYYLLLSRARELGLDDVFFAGSVPQTMLNAYFQLADVFLCMSEHEGFCIPLVESIVHDVPILAYAAGAVPETLDGAGVLFRDKDYPAVSEMLGRLAGDAALRERVLTRQRERLHAYEGRDLAAELRGHLAPLLDGDAGA